ncbi:MAG: hypothetical protein ACOVO9_10805 [Bacteroidia bacterium]
MNKFLLILGSFLLLLGACKKDLNFNKFDELTLSPEYAVPLAIIDLEMNDLLKEDSNIVYDNTGLIHFVFKEDTIASFPVDSFVKLPVLDPISSRSSLGVLDIENTSTSDVTTLADMATNFNAQTKAALNAANGTVTIFPAITDNNSTVTVLPYSNSNFSNITLSKGFLVLEFRNRLPVTIDVVRLNLFNMIPFQSLIGQVLFTNIPPGGNKKDSINLAGATLSNSLGYSLPQFRSFASQAPVLVNLGDSIIVDAKTSNLKCASGFAVFPSSQVNPQTVDIDIKADDPTAKIKYATFNTGLINYKMVSTIKEKLNLKIVFPGATKNGSPFPPVVIDINNESKSGSIDIGGMKMDLTQDISQPYNKLKVLVEPTLVSSGQLKLFDSSDYVSGDFSFDNFQFEAIEGNLGKKTIPIEASDIKLDMLEDFNVGFNLDDPKLKINTNNSMGIPITVALDVKGISGSGATQKLNGPPFTIPYPTSLNQGSVNGTFVYDKNNSDLPKLVSLPPKQVTFTGNAQLDTSGNFDRNNDFIKRGSSITVGFEMDLPFSLKTNDFTLSDTSDNPFFEVRPDGTLGNFLLGKDFDSNNVEFIDLIVKMDNGIPFDGSLYMFFADKDGIIKDSVSTPRFIQAAIPDANGKTIKNTVSVNTIRLSGQNLAAMQRSNLSKMIFKFQISTYANGSQIVKIYSDYKSKIGLSAKIKLKNYQPLKK